MKLIIDLFKYFFLYLAEVIFSAARYLFNLLIAISESNIFTNEVIEEFSSRFYMLLGIFMLFKVSFSLINYVVNPEDFTDKQKGIGKLVPNIMITLVLIVMTPRVFTELMDIQRLILNQNFLEKIILGTNYDANKQTITGDSLSLEIFNSFNYYPENSVPSEVKPYTDQKNDIYIYRTFAYAFNSTSPYNAYKGIQEGTIESHALFTLISGVLLVLILIQFCFDIAIRTVKLGFLQLIACVPIMSRIDPKSSKDGMFSKWFKLCYKTYLDLFIRLAALYFAVAIIGIVANPDYEITVPSNSNINVYIVKGFIIIGVLIFAKQLPKILEDLFGFKFDSKFTLNPAKRFKEVPGSHLATAAVAGVGGFAAGTFANGYAAVKSKEWLSLPSSVIAGGFSSLFRSTYSGLKDNKNKPIKAISAGVKGSVEARNLRDERQIAGDTGLSGVTRRAGVAINNFAGITSGADRYDKELSSYNEYLKMQSGIEDIYNSERKKGKVNNVSYFKYRDASGETREMSGSFNVNVLEQEYELLKNNSKDATEIENARLRFEAAKKQGAKEYVSQSFNVDKNGEFYVPKDFSWTDTKGNVHTQEANKVTYEGIEREYERLKEQKAPEENIQNMKNMLEAAEQVSLVDKNMAKKVRNSINDMDYYQEQHSSYFGFKNHEKLADSKDIGKAWDTSKNAMHDAISHVKYDSEDYKKAMANKKVDQKINKKS